MAHPKSCTFSMLMSLVESVLNNRQVSLRPGAVGQTLEVDYHPQLNVKVCEHMPLPLRRVPQGLPLTEAGQAVDLCRCVSRIQA